MSDIKSWSPLASGNNAAAPDGFPEGMAPGDVNNAAREVMAAVRRQHEQAEWIDLGHEPGFASTGSFTIAGDVASIYHAGRRVRLTDAGTLHGRITASSYSAPDTTVEVALDSGSLSASLSAVAVAAISGTGGNRSVTPESIGAMPMTDYEEGSWTPTVAGFTTPGSNTYTTQVGRYVRVGNLVIAPFSLIMSAKDAAMAGNVRIDGLPFAASNVSGLITSGSLSHYNNIDLAAGKSQLGIFLEGNSSRGILVESGDNVGASQISSGAIASNTELYGTFTYRTD